MEVGKTKKWRNWSRVMICICVLMALLLFPFTRPIVLWLLPLGSGVDDLVFFVLVCLAVFLLLLRAAPVKDKLGAFCRWISK